MTLLHVESITKAFLGFNEIPMIFTVVDYLADLKLLNCDDDSCIFTCYTLPVLVLVVPSQLDL